MARSKPSALDALRKLREQREELDAREARLREEAATELGRLLIECGAETLEQPITLTAGTFSNVLRFLPPLVIGQDLLTEALDVLDAVFAEHAG